MGAQATTKVQSATRLGGISPALSAFIDLLRISAAGFVFISHLLDAGSGNDAFAEFRPLAHGAVVVFFVVSGYVIASAARRDGNATDYAVNRAARIYSVVLPALVLTFVLDVLTGNTSYQHSQLWKYVPVFLTFTTDWWFMAENAFSNIPYWSLSYEVWYYVIFGIVLFGRGQQRWLLAGALLILMGPRHLLLLPIWLLGVSLHYVPRASRPRLLLVGALLGLVALGASGLATVLNNVVDSVLGGFAKAHLRYSQYFIGDYLIAALTGLAIVAARDGGFTSIARWQTPLNAAASVSFSLYLMHYPLIEAFNKIFPQNYLAIGAATLICVVAFGVAFERNKAIAHRIIIAVAVAPFRTMRP